MAAAGRLKDRAAWGVVAGAYLLIFGGILWHTRGLPYAIDNNESFSSLLHARNLHDVSLGVTKGLTDEAAAWHPAASPFVHTHQGNVPRLFSFLLYLLGARSIESQIVITTFSVGLLAVWFSFRFLRSVGPPVFAAIACLVLVSDYGLYGQWQVNTYRVWYGFFFFSSLLWVQACGQRKGRWMLLLGLLNFAAMFYGEYVYATFVAAAAALYACILYRRDFGMLVRLLCIEAVGAAAAGATLLAQLTAYMGWDNVKRDIRYTLSARNMAFDQSFADEANRFYAEHHIVFFQNYRDTVPLRHFGYFFTSLFENHLQYYGAWVCLSSLIVLLGVLLGLLCRPAPVAAGASRESMILGVMGTAVSAVLVFCLFRGVLSQIGWFTAGTRAAAWEDAAIAVVALAWVATIARLRARPGQNPYLLPWSNVLRGSAALVAAIIILGVRERLFGAHIERQWHLLVSPETGFTFGALAFAACSLFAFAVAALGAARVLGQEGRLTRLYGLSAALFLAYALVYRIFTGYIFSGYISRQAPFLVFWTDILLGGSLFLVYQAARRLVPLHRWVPVAALSFILLAFVGAWSSLQTAYWQILPPTRFSFLHLLNKSPFRGRTFVADTYAAPIAQETGAWAYAESSLFSGQVTLSPDGFVTEHDTKYLWFADAETNPEYLKPDFGIKIAQPANISEAIAQSAQPQANEKQPIAFASIGSVERSLAPLQGFLKDEVVASDGSDYTIVKFDWDFPPFLRPVDDSVTRSASTMSIQQKMAVSRQAQELHRHWWVGIEPLGRANLPAPQPAGRLIASATIDGRQVFSQDDLESPKPLLQLVDGDLLKMRLRAAPGGGRVRVTINEMTRVFDLGDAAQADGSISFSAGEPYGKHNEIPNFPAGLFVKTTLVDGVDGPAALVTYHYAQQERKEQQHTTIRVYRTGTHGDLQIIDAISYLGPQGIPVRMDQFRRENPETLAEYARVAAQGDSRTYDRWLLDHLLTHPGELNRPGIVQELRNEGDALPATSPHRDCVVVREIPLPAGLVGLSQISVTPGTGSKDGPEYFGFPFSSREVEEGGAEGHVLRMSFPEAETAPIPYGALKLRLRFPAAGDISPEPIVSTGLEDAGDFLYVTYVDTGHIRIGFDHWFIGGPLTPPLPVDFTREHEMEVSMGSLFPSSQDFLFEGVPKADVARIKGTLRVVLDGAIVLDSQVKFYASSPDEVTIGRNLIKGTSSNALFSGEILEHHRFWPKGLTSPVQSKDPKQDK